LSRSHGGLQCSRSPTVASPQVAARRIFRAVRPNHIDNSVRVAGRYVVFSSFPSGYLVDTRARRYMRVGGDPVALDQHALIVSSWTKGKSLHPRNRIMFVSRRALPRRG
jgi:hypothetical protein